MKITIDIPQKCYQQAKAGFPLTAPMIKNVEKAIQKGDVVNCMVLNCLKDIEVDKGYLEDWFISSVNDDPPVWTEKHIRELIGDFHLIPRGR